MQAKLSTSDEQARDARYPPPYRVSCDAKQAVQSAADTMMRWGLAEWVFLAEDDQHKFEHYWNGRP
jgi:hypothetical protein